jgi:DNA-binding CsgD family transcriptional regulator
MNLSWFMTTVNALGRCDSPTQLRAVLSQQLVEIGLTSWMIAVQIPSSLKSPETYGLNNYNDEWWQEYIENNWIIHDPLPRYCLDHDQPRFWTLAGWADVPGHRWEQDDTRAVDFFEQVERFGAKSGLIMPYHLSDNARAGINLPHPEPIDVSRGILMLARIWVYAALPEIISSVQRTYRQVKGVLPFRLTPREKEVLMWVGEGLTSKAIADHLGISFRTVEQYVANIQRKLDVSNRQQAITKAVNLGIICPTHLLDGMTYSISANKESRHFK